MLERKALIVSIFGSSFQNVVLGVSNTKNSKMFLCICFFPLFLVFLRKCLSKCPSPKTPPSHTPLKYFWFRT